MLNLLSDITVKLLSFSGAPHNQFRARRLSNLFLPLVLLLASTSALAQQATPTTQVGDTVTHPVTGETSTVVAVLPNFGVLTSNNSVILIFVNLGDMFTPTGGTTPVTVVSVTVNGTTGLIDTIVVDPNDPDNPPDPPAALVTMDVARNVDQEVADAIADAAGAAGDPGGDIQVTVPTGNSNVFPRRRVGSSGSAGNDGYGLEICDPFGILGCAIIGYGGTDGGDGNAPSDMIYTVGGGDIQSVSNGLHGIQVVSIGGNGGTGGDAYGNFDGRRGGNAGPGGTVRVTSNVNIATSGEEAHGIFGQSRAGRSGAGGSGYIFGGGGDGGEAALGGSVTLINNGAINTIGNGSHGMYAISQGGAAGTGGDSWGFVGAGGSSLLGGDGGTASVTNNGSIVTEGFSSHGVLTQSIGGTGGNGGDAGGIVAFGGSGSAGGDGGTSVANNGANAQIVTRGNESIGVLAQSIGGGGGDGGVSGGVVAFGGTGSAGGSGGTVRVTNADGSSITTEGQSAHGVLAQSVGGGGGNGATAGAFVALGGNGGAAGAGGSVTVNSGADITTTGVDSRGLFAQSVGGGGGSANGTGGLVSLGGNGGSGGSGGSVEVDNSGTIVTQGSGGDAIYAQSVGGGGGSGAASGGAISIGGAGSGGGSASTVNVTNDGTLVTNGSRARGIFAQSIGGGGGSGGDSGGLVSIGGRGAQASSASTVDVINNGSIATLGNQASAIQAQSIGGGGGDGGTTGGVLLTMGGLGGGGGAASTVTVESNRNLTTQGADSHGIFAQAVGGGGGNGGNASSGSLFAGVSIGGAGGLGGDGATVNVRTNEYDADLGDGPVTLVPLIQTAGDRANGILAQSVGGGGGNGGFAVQATVGTFLSASVAVGGSAGNGGIGGTVNVDSTAAIVTDGENADGIIAQSVGGGGGNGGFAISGSIQANPAGGASVAVGVGGSGGGGGMGGDVNADFTGSIQTSGEMSEGFIAQSLGGGGGNGGFSIAGSISLGGTGAGAVAVGVGGSGDVGGAGGDVIATATGTVITQGNDSGALLFQSVGGGGGNGGYNISGALSGGGVGSLGVNVGVGGSGAGGGDGGLADGRVVGDIATSGDRSTAVTVQSVGGGGGNGAFNIGLSGSAAGTASGAVNVGLGGSGAGGGDGGTVIGSTAGTIQTTGDESKAVLFQSVGGGGGNGGFNIGLGASGAGTGSGAVNVGIGGSGAGGGDGGDVTGSVTGTIMTTGLRATGVTVQSIGGGGGDGGFNIGLGGSGAGTVAVATNVGLGGSGALGGDGGVVIVTDMNADVSTAGDEAHAVLLQSLGGGGGNAGFNITSAVSGGGQGGAINVNVGGGGGPGGSGDTVTATDLRGNLQTSGDDANGILAQSIGGGGGNAALNIGLALGLNGVGVSVGIGGAAGDAGNGAAVDVAHVGDITTNGLDSAGVLAQSVGGGGGNTSMNIASGYSSLGKIDVGIGRMGGIGGSGGTVTVSTDGTITTFGDGSAGVLAQSVGNGGGKSGNHSFGAGGGSGANAVALGLSLGLEGGQGGTAAAVDVTTRGRVQTAGNGSDAIFAQSIGGGGGIGGMATLPVFKASTIGASLGGVGGSGGTSGTVTVTNFADLLTLGEESKGIFAQSIGGGGGNGGIAATGGIQTGPIGATLTMGGNGGSGAVANDVTVTNSGIIDTRGARSDGVYAQSLGGGGGNGGLTLSGVITAGNTPGTNLAMAVVIGADGGTGAAAGDTDVVNTGTIVTAGEQSNGIFAQSIGGGGGNGGLTANLLVDRTAGGGQFGLTIGGNGGSGGTGGDVTVDNLRPADGSMGGVILTTGAESHGIFAQSIGGGGGNSAATLQLIGTSGDRNLQVGVAIGGDGGAGGTGGAVTVTNDGVIETQGDDSHGVYAQSIGGGGGNSGVTLAGNVIIRGRPSTSVSPLLTLGGIGGDGNDGGTVVVNNNGSILTRGANAHGIVAQSIGGGGGDSTLTFGKSTGSDAVTQGVSYLGSLLSALGSSNSNGGLGGDVTVNHTGDITTLGDGSEAIVAQSINGGGGTMNQDFLGIGDMFDLPIDGEDLDFGGTRWGDITDSGSNPLMRFDLGAFGTADSNAGTVTINSSGTINTAGADSIGQSIQAIGGGGGVLRWHARLNEGVTDAASLPLEVRLGGMDGQRNAGGDIDTAHSGDSLSMGVGSHGALLQSIGGGGGRGVVELELGSDRDADLTFQLGGSGGTDESGGMVLYGRDGNVVTVGDQTLGVAVQSIGGGGGILSARVDDTPVNAGDPQTAMAEASFSLGALSGTLLDGGDLDVTLDGDLLTQGAQSHGLFLQSIGAGGGLAQFSGAATAIDASLGSSGGASGDGGNLSLVNNGNVWTEGEMAHGVFLQSIGGGGGAIFTNGFSNPLDLMLYNAGMGDGGAVSFVQNGDISTAGDGAYGIFIQSLGGGGGVVNDQFAGAAGGSGAGGEINLQIAGNVMALADGATAIFVQSDGTDGGGDITLSLLGDNAVIAGAGGTAISISGGNNNLISNSGLVGTLDDTDGTAIATDDSASDGNETVVNSGRVVGSVLLGAGDNFFVNEAGAYFYSGTTIELDTERTGIDTVGALINFGTLSQGGVNRILETAVDGRYVQSDEATLMADLDLSRRTAGPHTDRLLVSGSALLAGTVDISMANAGYALPGDHVDVLISADGGYGRYEGMAGLTSVLGTIGAQPDLTLSGIPNSVVASFDLGFRDGTEVVLNSNINFAPEGLNGNQSSLGEHVNNIQLAGGSEGFAPVASTLFFTETLADIQDIYNMLSPEPFADAVSHALLSSTQFGELLSNCRNRRGDASLSGEGRCGWLKMSYRHLERDATQNSFRFEQEGVEISAGAEYEIDGRQHFGFGASFMRGESRNGILAAGDSDLYQVGVLHRQSSGRFALTNSLALGYGAYDAARRIELPSYSGIAQSSPVVHFGSLHSRLSYDRGGEDWYLRSNLEAGVTYVGLKSFSEHGVDAVSLNMPSLHDTFMSVHPSLEFGRELIVGARTRLRPYGRVGVLHIVGRNSPRVLASFSAAPGNVMPFSIESGMDRNYGDFAIGLDLLGSDENLFRIESNGLLGSDTDSLGIEASWSYAF